MGFLIAAFVLLFLLLLLSVPLILEARVRLGLRGAAVRARLYVFGLVPIPLKLSLRLFSDPYFTLRFRNKTTPLLKSRRTGGEIGLLKGVRLFRLDSVTTVGIRGDPARAVCTAGTFAVLLSVLTARYAENGSANARFSETPMIRLSFRVSASLFPLEMLFGFLRARRIARRKAANNSRKRNEKREKTCILLKPFCRRRCARSKTSST